MGYPHLHQAVYSITESVLEQLEIDDIEKFKNNLECIFGKDEYFVSKDEGK